MTSLPIVGEHRREARTVELAIDGRGVCVPEGASLLEACRASGISIPTLCFADNLAPQSACRLCVVELAGSRTLVPSCSRRAEPGMVVTTDSERVKTARKLVLELLASSVDVSATPGFAELLVRYGAEPERFGPRAASPLAAGAQGAPAASTATEPPKLDNDLYVRDLGKCILCYRCVEACGEQAQGSFAIAVAGRGFEARISTELDVPLPESACVYCGNCVGLCPTGALVGKVEHDLRAAGAWDEATQTRTETVCSYCGVGCALTLHVQQERIVKVSSPLEASVTRGHLCVKGRFGFQFVRGG